MKKDTSVIPRRRSARLATKASTTTPPPTSQLQKIKAEPITTPPPTTQLQKIKAEPITTTSQPINTSLIQAPEEKAPTKGGFPGTSYLGAPLPWLYPQGFTKADKARKFWKSLKFSYSRKPNAFNYGPEEEEKVCVLSSGETFTWKEKSCGHTWIAVKGVKSHCVVVMDAFPNYEYKVENRPPITMVTCTVLNQMQLTDSTFHQMVTKRARGKPFVVVSVAPGTIGGSYEPAIEFLREKLKDRSVLTGSEILKLAVCALKCLFGGDFKSDLLQKAFYQWGEWNGRYGKFTPSDVDEYLKLLKDTTSDQPDVQATS